MRKEPIVFIAVAAFVGWQYTKMQASAGSGGRPPRPTPKDYVSAGMPDVDLAMADASRGIDFDRDLFSPPSPTQPLPPLTVALPPLEPLGALAAPTGFGPNPEHYGSVLRRPDRPAGATDLPGLFDLEDTAGGEDVVEQAAEVVDPLDELKDPDARAARIASLKKQYDWLVRSEFKFGRIQNANRYTPGFLNPAPGTGDEIVFLEVNPATGAPKFGGQTVNYLRENVSEFGLVDNPLTRIEVGHASFPEPIPSSRFDDALRFANECILLRNETPRALEVAVDMFQRAQAINLQDSAGPRLGLARCYELGFRLEDAYKAYTELLETGHGANAVVHARLAGLLATLRMDDAADARFAEAVAADRSNWEARWRYGEYLVSRGRAEEALPHLKEAVLREPKGTDERPWRVRIRLANAKALLAAGMPDEAFDAFSVAKSADVANEVGLLDVVDAGLMSAARFSTRSAAQEVLSGGTDGEPVDGSFDFLLSSGLVATDNAKYGDAATTLLLAVQADPFRAGEAYRALSRLAEITSNPEDAVRFADLALAANPMDPWALVHRGRLSQVGGDPAEAEAAYRASLDLELDLVPALERMAELMQKDERHESAERYYARAVRIAPNDAKLHSRRGWNALSLGRLNLAEEALREARRLNPALISARAGLAWWHYAAGDSTEALTLFGEIIDDRLAQGEADPILAYAQEQSDRIRDHESKEVFTDRFERANGRIGNDWNLDQGFGPIADLSDGHVVIDGNQDRSGRTRVFRALPPDRFLVFSCRVTIGSNSKGTRAGIFVSSERTRPGGEAQVMSEIVLSRSRDGELQVRVLKNPNQEDANHVNVPGPTWPLGKSVLVTIERTGDDLDSRYTLYLDGEPVAQDLEADRLTASTQPVNFGVFVEGEPGRVADIVMDDVRIQRRK